MTYSTWQLCNFLLGCLQAMFGIHTFRLESVAQGKAAYVDELQIQGVSNPQLLRKVNAFFPIKWLARCLSWQERERERLNGHFTLTFLKKVISRYISF